mmetsp:Transcript_13482/g.40059  ORF Transcript_13482/g.40059 Transcript_13482/m.40059 type:complete len:269 (-) Transcript_13482:877-1683(-)
MSSIVPRGLLSHRAHPCKAPVLRMPRTPLQWRRACGAPLPRSYLEAFPQENAVRADHVAHLAAVEELHVVQVAGQVPPRGVELPCLPGILRDVHDPTAAHGPALNRRAEREVDDADAARADRGVAEQALRVGLELLETVFVARRQVAAVQAHPHAVGLLVVARVAEAHGLDPARGHAVVRDPPGLARCVGEVEVAALRHRQVGALRGSLDRLDGAREVRSALHAAGGHPVEGGVNRFLHQRLPILAIIFGGVHRSRRRGHLCIAGAFR